MSSKFGAKKSPIREGAYGAGPMEPTGLCENPKKVGEPGDESGSLTSYFNPLALSRVENVELVFGSVLLVP